MDYEIEYVPKKEIVCVKVKGRLNFQVAEKYSNEARKLAHENNCSKFLIDHTETIMRENNARTHATGDELQQFGFKNTDTIAVVINNPNNNTTLKNDENQNSRWSKLKFFYKDDLQSAFDWLINV